MHYFSLLKSCGLPDDIVSFFGSKSLLISGLYILPGAAALKFRTAILCRTTHKLRNLFLKACAQRFRYALFAFIHTQTYFEYYTLTLRLASLVKKAVIYAYWTKELFDICRENVSHMATLPSVARHVTHADNLGPRH